MADLSNAPLVLIWRRVLDVPLTRKTVQEVNGWSLIGEDSFSAMYDAGNVLVAYWNQTDYFTNQAASDAEGTVTEKPGSGILDATTACSVENGTVRTDAFNPSNQLVLAVQGDIDVVSRLGGVVGQALSPAEVTDSDGTAVSFVDDVGNTTRYLRVATDAAKGLGGRLNALAESGVAGRPSFNPAVGYELLASNLDLSRRFYGDVLGLPIESAATDGAVFDAGNLLLRLRSEPSSGLVDTVRNAGKLKDDLVVFHVEHMESAVATLSKKGVVFPNGIEDSAHGRLALFEDPDGHSLSIWQPPARPEHSEIDYFPVLDRLLGQARRASARSVRLV